jgi:hypothetical protein
MASGWSSERRADPPMSLQDVNERAKLIALAAEQAKALRDTVYALEWLDDEFVFQSDAGTAHLGARWRQVCIRAGCVRSTAWRRWAAALLTISKKLNFQTKSKRKLKVPDATGAIPRESVVNTSNNPQNLLNFGRDISSGSEA